MGLSIGKDAPKKVNAYIEIPKGSNVKYELDEETGMIKVDRILHTAMVYPYNYGFIAGTKGEDGDPLDVMVISSAPFATGTFVVAKPIGNLLMKDEEGIDTKVMAVPTEKADPDFGKINDVSELNDHMKNMIAHFFSYYKSLEPGKWAEVSGWEDSSKAQALVQKSSGK